MTIVRNEDGTLVVPVRRERRHDEHEEADDATTEATSDATRVLHPGEGGYDEALVEWDLQQNPDREPAVSTPSGRQEAMALVYTVAESPKHDVSAAIEQIDDPEASGEALRHVLVGGVHSVEDFAVEISEVEGGEPLPAHKATKIIGGAYRAGFLTDLSGQGGLVLLLPGVDPRAGDRPLVSCMLRLHDLSPPILVNVPVGLRLRQGRRTRGTSG